MILIQICHRPEKVQGEVQTLIYLLQGEVRVQKGLKAEGVRNLRGGETPMGICRLQGGEIKMANPSWIKCLLVSTIVRIQ